jgi:hypothetical protein
LPEKFEAEIKKLKTVLGHVGLYVGLIAYTALGALVIHKRYSLTYFGHSTTLSDGSISIKRMVLFITKLVKPNLVCLALA